jgi:hypothetical protein
MDYILKLMLALTASLPTSLYASDAELKPAAEGIVDSGAVNAPRLEIRKYRFFHDVKLQRERLVLEFDRRDFYHESKPRVSFEALSSQEILIKVDNAMLMGAVPESLINDSYAHQSRYMGPISMDDRTMNSGIAMKVRLKDFDLGYKAEWLSSPSRLVVDVFTKTGPSAKSLAAGSHNRAPKSWDIRRKNQVPGVNDFLCFPGKARVALSVVFQPSSQREEELQKFRVNTDASALGLNSPVDRESIVCYPRTAQVKAQLSFQVSDSEPAASPTTSLFNFSKLSPPVATAPSVNSANAPAAQGMGTGTDADLDPGPVGGNSDGMAPTSAPGAAPSASPASLLPPLQ